MVWEVFEVHRTSNKAEAVSAGMEEGWLAFVSGDRKRRLAPFPSEWQSADVVELERLCVRARVARATGLGRERDGSARISSAAARLAVPRIRAPLRGREGAPDGELLDSTSTSADPVERTVRRFAHEARARGLPAIEAMVQLKALLGRTYPEASSVARDLRSVRRWFVEAYYFERDVTRPGTDDQSR